MSNNDLGSKVKKGFKDVVHYVNLHKVKAISSLSIVALLTAGSFAGDSYYKSNLVDLYHVYLHGEEIGVVESPKVVEEWLSHKKTSEENQYKGFDLQFDSDITYEHQTVYKGTFDNQSTLDVLANSVEVKAKAFKLVVNGEFIGYVRDQSAGEALFDSIKKQYTKDYDKRTVAVASLLGEGNEAPAVEEPKDAEKLKSVSIKEEIEYVPTIIEPTEMTDEEAISSILTQGVEQKLTYKVQSGDVLGKIAQKFDLKTSELIKLNPGITDKSILQIGQELNVTGIDSKITVQTVFEKTAVESIPFKVEYVDDKSLYKGETKVKQKGVKGEREVTYEIIKENGILVDRKELDEDVITDPVTQIVIRGTKALPTLATGKFSWPTKGGYISSNYGYRWGKLHTGMDIAGVKDKTIMAADNGKVTFAGWKGRYGNAIIIDHGGGYETLYGHLSKIEVEKGQKVAQGQKIGVMGSTGNSTGTHLHFEIIKDGKTTNPAKAFGK